MIIWSFSFFILFDIFGAKEEVCLKYRSKSFLEKRTISLEYSSYRLICDIDEATFVKTYWNFV